MTRCTLCSIGVYRVCIWFAYRLVWRWCVEIVSRFDDNESNVFHLPLQMQPESRLWKFPSPLKPLWELLLLTWKVSRVHRGWSWLGCWPIEPKHQSGKELMILLCYLFAFRGCNMSFAFRRSNASFAFEGLNMSRVSPERLGRELHEPLERWGRTYGYLPRDYLRVRLESKPRLRLCEVFAWYLG